MQGIGDAKGVEALLATNPAWKPIESRGLSEGCWNLETIKQGFEGLGERPEHVVVATSSTGCCRANPQEKRLRSSANRQQSRRAIELRRVDQVGDRGGPGPNAHRHPADSDSPPRRRGACADHGAAMSDRHPLLSHHGSAAGP